MIDALRNTRCAPKTFKYVQTLYISRGFVRTIFRYEYLSTDSYQIVENQKRNKTPKRAKQSERIRRLYVRTSRKRISRIAFRANSRHGRNAQARTSNNMCSNGHYFTTVCLRSFHAQTIPSEPEENARVSSGSEQRPYVREIASRTR